MILVGEERRKVGEVVNKYVWLLVGRLAPKPLV